VSDWGSINEMIAHMQKTVNKLEIAIKAGSDMDMESSAYVGTFGGISSGRKVSENLMMLLEESLK
jgi:beta-glucosidase